jgi:hypothetical protein
MLTANDSTPEGNLAPFQCANRCCDLCEFLQSRRAAQKKDIKEWRTFFSKHEIRYYPYCDSDSERFKHETRERYFGSIPVKALVHSLIFFDPDIGIETGTKYMNKKGVDKDKYLFRSDIEVVARKASDDSVLVIYQHLQRNRNLVRRDIEDRGRKFARALRSPSIGYVWDRDLSFLVGVRDPDTHRKMLEILRQHAERRHIEYGPRSSINGC